MPTYFALLHKHRSRYAIRFPDFPDCEIAGDVFEDVYREAAGVLRTHLRQLRGRGKTIPEPSDRDAIQEIPNAKRGLLLRVDVP